jgi:uncharacterized membrane protein
MAKKVLYILILIIASVFAGAALLHPGLIPTHDGEYHVVRFYEFNKALLDGNWYPRWASDLNNGFGVPLFNFVYPLPNYFSSLIHLFGFSFIDSFKLEMFLSLIIGGIFFYLWAKQFWGDLGALTSSIFYVFSPYHFVDIYIRGSVGEVLALAIFPALLWSLTVFIKTGKKIFIPLSALLLGLMIFSHNILALMFSAFTFSYALFFLANVKDRRGTLIGLSKIAIIGLFMSSVFWLPALLETKFAVGLQLYDVTSNFPLLYQLLIPTWGSGFATSDLGSQLSFQIGMANLIAVFLIIPCIIFVKNKNRSLILFFLSWFFIVFFLMLQVSHVIWEKVPLMNYFQFPWRFLSLEIVIASFLAGAVVSLVRFKVLFACILILLAVSLGIGYAKPAYYLYREDSYYMTRSNFMDGTNSPGNAFNTAWFNAGLKKTGKRFVFVKGGGNITDVVNKNSVSSAIINASASSQIIVNTAYFPRWNVYIDNKQARVSGTSDGLFSFSVPEGKHSVLVRFDDTRPRQLGSLLFFIASIIIVILFAKAISDKIKK